MRRAIFATAFCLTIGLCLLSSPNELTAAAQVSPAPAIDPHGPPPPPPENPPPAPSNPPAKFRRVALEKFIAAYLEAARASDPEAELSFFADRVDYFGRPDTTREQIHQELRRDRARWPEREIKPVGQLAVDFQPNGQLRVTLPLHLALRHEHEENSSDVVRILVLEPQGPRAFHIVSLRERKSAS